MESSDPMRVAMSEGEAIPGECASHGPYTARIYTVGTRRITAGCPTCFLAERRRQAGADARAVVERVAAQNRPAFQMPKRYEAADFDSFERKTPEQEKVFRSCQGYAMAWPEARRQGRGLILSGEIGNGKTHLAIAIGKVAAQQGATVVFSTVADMAADVYETYGGDKREAQAIRRYSDADLLLLDELGVQSGSDHEAILLGRILNRRYNEMLPTVITTNLDPKAMRACLTDRITDRLRERGGKLVVFEGQSRRSSI